MDFIVGLIGESGLSPEDIEHETEKLGWKVSRYTIMGWLYKSVRRPQNYTMTVVALALGYTKTWTAMGSGARPAVTQPERLAGAATPVNKGVTDRPQGVAGVATVDRAEGWTVEPARSDMRVANVH